MVAEVRSALPADPVPTFVRPRYPLRPATRRVVDRVLDVFAVIMFGAVFLGILAGISALFWWLLGLL